MCVYIAPPVWNDLELMNWNKQSSTWDLVGGDQFVLKGVTDEVEVRVDCFERKLDYMMLDTWYKPQKCVPFSIVLTILIVPLLNSWSMKTTCHLSALSDVIEKETEPWIQIKFLHQKELLCCVQSGPPVKIPNEKSGGSPWLTHDLSPLILDVILLR